MVVEFENVSGVCIVNRWVAGALSMYFGWGSVRTGEGFEREDVGMCRRFLFAMVRDGAT